MGAGATVARALINCSIAKTRVRKIGEITLPSLSLSPSISTKPFPDGQATGMQAGKRGGKRWDKGEDGIAGKKRAASSAARSLRDCRGRNGPGRATSEARIPVSSSCTEEMPIK